MPICMRRLIFEAPMLLFWQFHLLGDFPVQLACSLSGGLGSGLYLAFWAETGLVTDLRFHFLFLISLPSDVNSPLLRYISPCTCAVAKAYRLSVYVSFLTFCFLESLRESDELGSLGRSSRRQRAGPDDLCSVYHCSPGFSLSF